MKLKIALEDKKFDVRIRDRLVSQGSLNQEDVQGYLKDLEDDSDNVKPEREY